MTKWLWLREAEEYLKMGHSTVYKINRQEHGAPDLQTEGFKGVHKLACAASRSCGTHIHPNLTVTRNGEISLDLFTGIAILCS